MTPIPVRPYPPARSFDSIEAAIAHARSHPRQPDARRDAARLAGAALVDAAWTLTEWVLRFDSGLCLRVWADGAQVRWSLGPGATEPGGGPVGRVGAPPVVPDWGTRVGSWEMDCSAFVATRRGASFHNLFVNDQGFFVYFRGLLILCFGVAERVADGSSILYVYEDD